MLKNNIEKKNFFKNKKNKIINWIQNKNPFFKLIHIIGKKGIGKTHLIKNIKSYFQKKNNGNKKYNFIVLDDFIENSQFMNFLYNFQYDVKNNLMTKLFNYQKIKNRLKLKYFLSLIFIAFFIVNIVSFFIFQIQFIMELGLGSSFKSIFTFEWKKSNLIIFLVILFTSILMLIISIWVFFNKNYKFAFLQSEIKKVKIKKNSKNVFIFVIENLDKIDFDITEKIFQQSLIWTKKNLNILFIFTYDYDQLEKKYNQFLPGNHKSNLSLFLEQFMDHKILLNNEKEEKYILMIQDILINMDNKIGPEIFKNINWNLILKIISLNLRLVKKSCFLLIQNWQNIKNMKISPHKILLLEIWKNIDINEYEKFINYLNFYDEIIKNAKWDNNLNKLIIKKQQKIKKSINENNDIFDFLINKNEKSIFNINSQQIINFLEYKPLINYKNTNTEMHLMDDFFIEQLINNKNHLK